MVKMGVWGVFQWNAIFGIVNEKNINLEKFPFLGVRLLPVDLVF